MKNVYVSPEVELICLAPSEKIAALADINLGGVLTAATGSVADIDVKAAWFFQ